MGILKELLAAMSPLKNKWFAGCAAIASAVFLSACATSPRLARYEFSQAEMGLPFRIVLYAPDEGHARDAAEAAFQKIHELNGIFSDYDLDSELSRLSRSSEAGTRMRVSDDLWKILQTSRHLSERSGGSFDITVGPVVNLWRKARREHRLPDPRKLAEARAVVGYTNLMLHADKTVSLALPGMRLDLGAIAKGYAIDAALREVKAKGIGSALIAGGGDMVASGAPPGGRGWRIEIGALDVTNAPPARFVSLRNAALATSGDLFQHLEVDGIRYSHIVDPKTGIGITDHSLVTVIAGNCETADSLATAVSVMGSRDGIKLIRSLPGTAVRIVRKPRDKIEVSESPGFARYYVRETDAYIPAR